VGLKSTKGDSWFDRRVSPSFLFVTGLLLVPAIILQQHLAVKAAQTCLFLGLAMLSVPAGKRRLIVGSAIFIVTTIIVNLFSPVGRVIVKFGPLRVTQGALRVGLSKATTLTSLLYVSRFCVRPTVRLPGLVGQTVSETFTYLGKLLAEGRRLSRHDVVRSLDERFEKIFNSEDQLPAGQTSGGSTVIGLLALAILLLVNWGALFLPFSALLVGL
jgi:hypothetical protein